MAAIGPATTAMPIRSSRCGSRTVRGLGFQIVKHDVWDYDVPAQPTLATIDVDGQPRDVVVQATKQGFVFVLDRDSGEPVFPVEERAVPQGAAPGEQLSATQTFPADLPALVPQHLRTEDGYGFTFFDRNACREQIAALRSEGLYTPPDDTRHSAVPGHQRRGQLGRRRNRPAKRRLCEHDAHRACSDADPARPTSMR